MAELFLLESTHHRILKIRVLIPIKLKQVVIIKEQRQICIQEVLGIAIVIEVLYILTLDQRIILPYGL